MAATLSDVESRVAELLDGFTPAAVEQRQRAEDLLAAVLAMYGAAFGRAVELARAAGCDEVVARWEADELLSELFELHLVGRAPVDVGDARRTSGVIESLSGEVSESATEHRRRTEEAVALVVDLHGEGLYRMALAVGAGDHRHLVDQLAGDDTVASALLVHGLHPEPAEVRLRSLVDELSSRSGPVASVVLESFDGHRARLRVEGSNRGDAWRLRLALERGFAERVPDIDVVEIEGGEEPQNDTQVLIPVEAIGRRSKPSTPSPAP